jgi:hypothetical protein
MPGALARGALASAGHSAYRGQRRGGEPGRAAGTGWPVPPDQDRVPEGGHLAGRRSGREPGPAGPGDAAERRDAPGRSRCRGRGRRDQGDAAEHCGDTEHLPAGNPLAEHHHPGGDRQYGVETGQGAGHRRLTGLSTQGQGSQRSRLRYSSHCRPRPPGPGTSGRDGQPPAERERRQQDRHRRPVRDQGCQQPSRPCRRPAGHSGADPVAASAGDRQRDARPHRAPAMTSPSPAEPRVPGRAAVTAGRGPGTAVAASHDHARAGLALAAGLW